MAEIDLLVNLDPLIQGETGTSLIALNAFAPQSRRNDNYWLALISMLGLGALMFTLLRGRLGGAVQAIRDSEEAATSLGVRVLGAKQVLFVVAGHVVGVVLAHDRAVRLLPRRTAVVGQVPLLLVMIGYTLGGLLLLFTS